MCTRRNRSWPSWRKRTLFSLRRDIHEEPEEVPDVAPGEEHVTMSAVGFIHPIYEGCPPSRTARSRWRSQQAPSNIGVLDEERPFRRKDSGRPAEDQLAPAAHMWDQATREKLFVVKGQGGLRGEGRSIEGHEGADAQEEGHQSRQGDLQARGEDEAQDAPAPGDGHQDGRARVCGVYDREGSTVTPETSSRGT